MSRINHELRTPLNAVIGFSEVMALEMFGPLGNERYQEYARYIRDSAGDLLKSAEDTLALHRAAHQRPQPAEAAIACTLDHAIADAWAFVERKAAGARRPTQPHASRGCRGSQPSRAPCARSSSTCCPRRSGRAAPGARVSLVAVADGELIEIVLSVGGEQACRVPKAGSLAICLARTLLEMQGTSLLEIETAGGWRAVTVLDRAVQPDFFAGRVRDRRRTSASRRWPSSAQRKGALFL